MPTAPHACPLDPLALYFTNKLCIFLLQIALYSISFGFAWGPVGWLVPSEIHDLNTRSAGQSITVFTQLVSGATVTQSENFQLLATFPGCTAGVLAFGSMLRLLSHCNHNDVQCLHKIVVKSTCFTIWLEAGNGFCADTWATSTLV